MSYRMSRSRMLGPDGAVDRRGRRLGTVALLAASLFAAGSTIPAPAAILSAAPRPHVARLEIRVKTSSDWTKIEFSPGYVYASRVTSASAGANVVKLTTGALVEVAAPFTDHQVTLSAIYEDTGQSPLTTIVVSKGSWGQATVDITNTSSPVRSRVTSIVNGNTGGATNDTTTTVDSRKVFGRIGPHYAPADTRRLVLSFYYGWWKTTEYYSAIPFLTAHPSDPRGTDDAAGVMSMTKQARANGIDGFIVSWAGETNDGRGFDLALRAAEATRGVTTAVLETVRATPTGTPDSPTDPAIVELWLRQLLLRTGSRAFLRSGGVPVIFVFEMARLSPAAWIRITADLAASGMPVRLVGDTLDTRYRSVLWGFYHYNPMGFSIKDLRFFDRGAAAETHLLDQPSMLFAATASPGFDDHLMRSGDLTVPRGAQGERYTGTWIAAAGSAADWVLITSWNEWSEATSIEPSVEYGDLALRQTARYAAYFHKLTKASVRAG